MKSFLTLLSCGALLLGHTSAVDARPTFKGYVCQTSDCAGHNAGYRWAAKNNISQPQACRDAMRRSQAFGEGCMAYVEGS